jgi:hypothetical protein
VFGFLVFAGTMVFVMREEWVTTIAVCCCILGYVFMGLSINAPVGGALRPLRGPAPLGVMLAISGFGMSLLYNLLLQDNVFNLMERRGAVVAVLATCVGLSASLFTLFYDGPFHKNVGDFLLFLGIVCSIACMVAGLIVRRVDRSKAFGPDAPSVLSPRAMLVSDDDNCGAGGDGSSNSSDDFSSSSSEYTRMGDGANAQQKDVLLQLAPSRKGSHRDLNSVNGGHHHAQHVCTTPFDAAAAQLDLQSSPGGRRTSAADALLVVHTPGSHHLPNYSSSNDESEASPGADGGEDGEGDHGLLYVVSKAEVEMVAVQARTCGGGLMGRIFGALFFLVRSKVYWLMLVNFFLLGGAGMAMINNRTDISCINKIQH